MKKKNSLIVSDKDKLMQDDSWNQKEFYRELVIKRYNPTKKNRITRLSEVLTKLPSGIVYKDETGMGATTLELKSKRNSIIVEPIKITASSKAYRHKALYVGSPTENFHPNKIEDRQIHDYLVNPKIKFKKIIVVADSLGKVINAILDVNQQVSINATMQRVNALKLSKKFKETAIKNMSNFKQDKNLRRLQNLSLLNDYFLLIDEVDSFQLDSAYRLSMENCLDAYKLFSKDNRCMLSATDIMFSDPDLQDEAVTFIKYNIPSKRQIDIITSGGKQLQGKAYDRIVETLQKFPDDKILVAYNTVNGCYNLAENLILNNILKNEEIAILCSNQSKEKVNEYYKELNSDKLPTKLNFITSAYFTGFDLHESYHLISISGNRSNTQALSERRLKQIAGRCRTGLLSETIIHDIVVGGTFRNSDKGYISAAKIFSQDTPQKKLSKTEKKIALKEEPTKEDLIKAASEQVRSLDCMNKHYKNSKMLHEILEDVNDKFMKLLDEKQMRFIRRGQDKNLKISYLNIDAKLESLRVRKELYLFDDALTLKLKKAGHNVNTIIKLKATEIIESKISKHEKDGVIREIIEKLKSVKEKKELEQLLKSEKITRYQKNIVRDFKRFYGYLESENFLNRMEQSLIGQRDNRKYNALLIAAQIQTLPEGHIIIDRLKYYFGIGKKYTPQEILKRMTLFLLETGNTKKLKEEREAIKMLNNFRKTYRKKDKHDGIIYYHVKNNNPHEIISIVKRQVLEEIEL